VRELVSNYDLDGLNLDFVCMDLSSMLATSGKNVMN